MGKVLFFRQDPQIEKLLHSKGSTEKCRKRQFTEWKKMFVKHIPDNINIQNI
jgi:hypothetical protein